MSRQQFGNLPYARVGDPEKGAASFEHLKPACQILILHEDFPAYSRAVEVCRRVMERFANELDFDIKCWSFIELADPNCGRHAAKTAGAADMVLLSLMTLRPPAELDRWFDEFFTARSKPEGVLALLLSAPDTSPFAREKLFLRLEPLAERLGMDFVPLLPGDDAVFLNLQPPGTGLRAACE